MSWWENYRKAIAKNVFAHAFNLKTASTFHNVFYSESEFGNGFAGSLNVHVIVQSIRDLFDRRGRHRRLRGHRGLDSEILRHFRVRHFRTRHFRVRQKMRLQIAPLIKAAIANRTFVRRLLHVQNLVNRQRPALTKSLAAIGAFERLLLAVYVSRKQ